MQFSMQCGFHSVESSVHVVCYSVLCCMQIRSEFTDHSLVWAGRSAFCIVAEMHFVQYTAMQCTAHSGRKLPRFPASLAIISISAQSVANPTICLNLVCAWQCIVTVHSAMQFNIMKNLKLPIFSGVIAYPAGCTVVLYNPRKNKQQHIANPGKKTITAVGWWVVWKI